MRSVHPSQADRHAHLRTIRPVMAVRLAEAEDHPALTVVLARAFDDDPILRWVFPTARLRERYGGEFFRWSLWRMADHGVAWTTDDHAGAAIWAPPERLAGHAAPARQPGARRGPRHRLVRARDHLGLQQGRAA